MITLLEIADLLASRLGHEDIFTGCINGSKEKQIGVYTRDVFVPRSCVGSKSGYQIYKIRILIHWTGNPTETEKKAHELTELLAAIESDSTEKHIVLWADPKGERLLGKDEKGICEAIVDADIIYSERK